MCLFEVRDPIKIHDCSADVLNTEDNRSVPMNLQNPPQDNGISLLSFSDSWYTPTNKSNADKMSK
jgi:hypothetical protein